MSDRIYNALMAGETPPWDEKLQRPKPPRRTKATAAEWKRIRAAKNGPCRVCGNDNTTLHHALPKSLGGDDTEDNMVPLCGDGTRGCHGLVEARSRVACAALGASLTDAERAYLLGKKGPVFLARYYHIDVEEAA